MSAPSRVVVVGAGQAAAQAVDELRRQGYEGHIVVIGDEELPPYQRPPLSKQYLAGRVDAEWVLYRPFSFYQRARVELRLGHRAVAVDPKAGCVELGDGDRLGYDRLLLATGCRARQLDVPGANYDGVHTLRTIDDADRIRSRLEGARDITIVGGGFIGLEVASVLVQLGRRVTVLEMTDRVLARAVAPEISSFFETKHHQRGVRILTNAAVKGIESDGKRLAVFGDFAADADELGADLVLAGVGVHPNDELAAEAGLACDDGILVDEAGRTTDPVIFAAGDCTRHPSALLLRSVRLETVHNAIEQARTAARSMLGIDSRYNQAPWVWSDQYDVRLQAVGDCTAYDHTVMRGTPDDGRFSILYYAGERFVGLSAVNRPADFGAARRVLDQGASLPSEHAADPAYDLALAAPRDPTRWFERNFSLPAGRSHD